MLNINGIDEISLIDGDAYPINSEEFLENAPGSFSQNKDDAVRL
ncbi:MAG: hypothetical protein PQJ61_09070 [Spirochaetales bacterium]|uniref:Uncharacterized protein n=1 Tax=Candidatus Thalassospirochaeta sargassi TaxID=3119039 RepID=A0AAJ1ICS2_9SPIO|nr:hypothetical protein [Spirochaetales bacterium]